MTLTYEYSKISRLNKRKDELLSVNYWQQKLL
jgi:hypothetical protein